MSIKNLQSYHINTDDFQQEGDKIFVKIQRQNAGNINRIAMSDCMMPRSGYTLLDIDSTFLFREQNEQDYQITLNTEKFYSQSTFITEIKQKLDATGQTYEVLIENGKLFIKNQANTNDLYFFNVSQNLANIIGFTNIDALEGIGGDYALTQDDAFVPGGLFNLNYGFSTIFILCDQVQSGYNNKGQSNILSHIYLHQVNPGNYGYKENNIEHHMKQFNNNSDYLTIQFMDQNKRILTRNDFNGVDINLNIVIFEYIE